MSTIKARIEAEKARLAAARVAELEQNKLQSEQAERKRLQLEKRREQEKLKEINDKSRRIKEFIRMYPELFEALYLYFVDRTSDGRITEEKKRLFRKPEYVVRKKTVAEVIEFLKNTDQFKINENLDLALTMYDYSYHESVGDYGSIIPAYYNYLRLEVFPEKNKIIFDSSEFKPNRLTFNLEEGIAFIISQLAK